MFLYFIKHNNSNQVFLFKGADSIGSNGFFLVGDTVVCKTRYGEKKGDVVGRMETSQECEAKAIATACGASWPLADVLRLYIKPIIESIEDIPAELVEKIQKQERQRILDTIKSMGGKATISG